MKKLFEVAMKRFNLREHSTRFLFDGERIKATDTPDSLGLENDDIVEIMEE